MAWKEVLKEYLTFSRKERIGILTIVAVIVAVWLSPKILSGCKKQVPVDSSWISSVKKLEHKKEDNSPTTEENSNESVYDRPLNNNDANQKAELFYFDPNAITVNEWKRLGLHDRTIHTIQNYLQKGGHFYKSSDLGKIYGLHADEYARLEPYIRIETTGREKEFSGYTKKELPGERPLVKSPDYRFIEINSADTTAFIALPGIGNKLALRIINFRDRLGGFYSVDQVGETYGLPDSTFQKIKQYLELKNTEVKKININTATKDEMKAHPYLKWNLANAIVEYRTQHGNYSSLEDLKKITLVTEDIYNKIAPYLRL